MAPAEEVDAEAKDLATKKPRSGKKRPPNKQPNPWCRAMVKFYPYPSTATRHTTTNAKRGDLHFNVRSRGEPIRETTEMLRG